jgi:hypothetical protein
MPRRKSTPTYQEGPQAFENFQRLATQLVQTPRRVLHSEVRETTVVRITDAVSRKKKKPIKK